MAQHRQFNLPEMYSTYKRMPNTADSTQTITRVSMEAVPRFLTEGASVECGSGEGGVGCARARAVVFVGGWVVLLACVGTLSKGSSVLVCPVLGLGLG